MLDFSFLFFFLEQLTSGQAHWDLGGVVAEIGLQIVASLIHPITGKWMTSISQTP